MEVDKISNLPGHIIDKILSYLSLRDAVRTSVLSTNWRYNWNTVPHLVFDNQSVLVSSYDENKLVNIVYRVLLLHSGLIQKFKIAHPALQGVSDIDNWILFLSRGALKEFVLEISKGRQYKLPSSIYICQNLVHLELLNCLLRPPATFDGFKNLKSIDLRDITMDQDAFEYLISSCPLLERLTLMNFDGFTNLNIQAPNLIFIDIGGEFENVIFQETFRLAVVSIGLYTNTGFNRNLTVGRAGNLIKFFAHLPRIQKLEVQNYFLKYLSAGKVPGRLPTPCIELSFLSLSINFNDLAESLAALCLLRSSPNLQQLEMLARQEEHRGASVSANIAEENFENCPFNQLQFVKIAGISGLRQELNFIEFLLANSPVLEKMTVRPCSIVDRWGLRRDLQTHLDLTKELLRLRRASVQAQIIYVEIQSESVSGVWFL